MSPAAAFLVGVGASVALALLAVAILRRTLAGFLAELCGGRRRGAFWVDVFSLAMPLASALAASLPDGLFRRSYDDPSALLVGVVVQALLGVLGIVAGVAVVAAFLLLWLHRLERALALRSAAGPIPDRGDVSP